MSGIPADIHRAGIEKRPPALRAAGRPFGATIGGFLPQMDRTAPTAGRSFAVRVQTAAH